jgi:hypothetical protein
MRIASRQFKYDAPQQLFEQFLADQYHRVWRFSDQDEIWQLK